METCQQSTPDHTGRREPTCGGGAAQNTAPGQERATLNHIMVRIVVRIIAHDQGQPVAQTSQSPVWCVNRSDKLLQRILEKDRSWRYRCRTGTPLWSRRGRKSCIFIQNSSFFMQHSPCLMQKSLFFMQNSSFEMQNHDFLNTNLSPIWWTWQSLEHSGSHLRSSFLMQNSSFLMQSSSFLMQNSSFLMQISSSLMQNSSFLICKVHQF